MAVGYSGSTHSMPILRFRENANKEEGQSCHHKLDSSARSMMSGKIVEKVGHPLACKMANIHSGKDFQEKPGVLARVVRSFVEHTFSTPSEDLKKRKMEDVWRMVMDQRSQGGSVYPMSFDTYIGKMDESVVENRPVNPLDIALNRVSYNEAKESLAKLLFKILTSDPSSQEVKDLAKTINDSIGVLRDKLPRENEERASSSPVVLTPDSMILDWINSNVYDLSESIVDDCKLAADFYERFASLVLNNLSNEYPLNLGDVGCATKFKELVDKATGWLSDSVPAPYVYATFTLLTERSLSGPIKSAYLGEILKPLVANGTLTSGELGEIVDHAKNLFELISTDFLTHKLANLFTTSGAFCMYVTGVVVLFMSLNESEKTDVLGEISKDLKSNLLSKNPEVVHALDIEGQSEISPLRNDLNSGGKSVTASGLEKFTRLAGKFAVLQRGVSNGLFTVKDAMPNTHNVNMLYNYLGKTIVPMGMMENLLFKESIIRENEKVMECNVIKKLMANEPLSEKEQDFKNFLDGKAGTEYEKTLLINGASNAFQVIGAIGLMAADMVTYAEYPDANIAFQNLGGEHLNLGLLYKTTGRALSLVLNTIQTKCAGYELSSADYEFLTFVSMRLFGSGISLGLWAANTTLTDTLGALVDVLLTYSTDEGAGLAFKNKRLESENYKASLCLKHLMMENPINVGEGFGSYLDRIIEQKGREKFEQVQNSFNSAEQQFRECVAMVDARSEEAEDWV